jgi:hypothetical protein
MPLCLNCFKRIDEGEFCDDCKNRYVKKSEVTFADEIPNTDYGNRFNRNP